MTIRAEVIADSISPQSIRLVTLQLRYPKFIHSEFMTHRVFSRNASSSRAIPVERLIQDVINDPCGPSYWGKNKPGMQAEEETQEFIRIGSVRYTAGEAWDKAREEAIWYARAFSEAGYHKQIVNRLLEPFCHINVVVTATEWSNFFALRCHPGAQPEMRLLAEAMRDAMEDSAPKLLQPGEWHLPYVGDDLVAQDYREPLSRHDAAIKVSVARCARVSYLTQEGKTPTIEADLALYNRLLAAVPLHASPAEHQATPDEWVSCHGDVPEPNEIGDLEWGDWKQSHLHGNLRGWIQFRKTLPGECQ